MKKRIIFFLIGLKIFYYLIMFIVLPLSIMKGGDKIYENFFKNAKVIYYTDEDSANLKELSNEHESENKYKKMVSIFKTIENGLLNEKYYTIDLSIKNERVLRTVIFEDSSMGIIEYKGNSSKIVFKTKDNIYFATYGENYNEIIINLNMSLVKYNVKTQDKEVLDEFIDIECKPDINKTGDIIYISYNYKLREKDRDSSKEVITVLKKNKEKLYFENCIGKYPVWNPKESGFYYAGKDRDENLYYYNLKTKESKSISSGVKILANMSVSDDGRFIAYLKNKIVDEWAWEYSYRPQLEIYNTDKKIKKVIKTFDDYIYETSEYEKSRDDFKIFIFSN